MKDNGMECCEAHKRKKGICMLIVGLIIVANAYWAFASWWMLVGALIALGGLGKAVMPMGKCK